MSSRSCAAEADERGIKIAFELMPFSVIESLAAGAPAGRGRGARRTAASFSTSGTS